MADRSRHDAVERLGDPFEYHARRSLRWLRGRAPWCVYWPRAVLVWIAATALAVLAVAVAAV